MAQVMTFFMPKINPLFAAHHIVVARLLCKRILPKSCDEKSLHGICGQHYTARSKILDKSRLHYHLSKISSLNTATLLLYWSGNNN